MPFDDIAELDLPARNAWDAYYESLALVGAVRTVRLMRIETFAGLVATTSYSAFEPGRCPAIRAAGFTCWRLEPGHAVGPSRARAVAAHLPADGSSAGPNRADKNRPAGFAGGGWK